MRLNLDADALLSTTRSVRKRLDYQRPVAREVVMECLELALQAPTGSNRQGWQWLFVTDDDAKQALQRIYAPNFAEYRTQAVRQPLPEDDPRVRRAARVADSAQYLADTMHRAPILLIPCLEGWNNADSGTSASYWGSILPAVWSFMLALRERGLGSSWTTLHLNNGGEQRAAQLLGIPDGYRQAGLFPIAYTKGTEFHRASRLPATTVSHWDRW
ncbi:MAG: nitroreductase family protein [Beutenbergiaceae bacterium]